MSLLTKLSLGGNNLYMTSLHIPAQGEFGKWHPGLGREYRKAFFTVYILPWWKNPPSLVRGGGCMPTTFHYLLSRKKLFRVYALAERADTLPLFLLYPYMYSVGCTSPCLIVVKDPKLVWVASWDWHTTNGRFLGGWEGHRCKYWGKSRFSWGKRAVTKSTIICNNLSLFYSLNTSFAV